MDEEDAATLGRRRAMRRRTCEIIGRAARPSPRAARRMTSSSAFESWRGEEFATRELQSRSMGGPFSRLFSPFEARRPSRRAFRTTWKRSWEP